MDAAFKFMSEILQIDVSVYDDSFLRKSIEKRMKKTSNETLLEYIRYLSTSGEEVKVFLHSLNITYSEFFRGSLTFGLLEQVILPKLFVEKRSSGSEIRIWSAGCASGQEAYSVAILLTELAETQVTDIPFRIFATDISEADIETARMGFYSSRSIQNLTLKYLEKYFKRQGEEYTVIPKLRERIEFSRYNLLDERSSCPPDSIFGNFDIVMCCNLLFYYRQHVRQFILGKMSRCLTKSGYLLTGEVETGIVEMSEDFRTTPLSFAVFQKTNRRK